MTKEQLPYWFPFLWFLGVWVLVTTLTAHVSGWPRLASRFRARLRLDGERLRGQVVGIGDIAEHNVTTLYLSPGGLGMAVLLPFRLQRPPLLIPWDTIRRVSENRILDRWLRSYSLDLDGVVTVRVKPGGLQRIRPFLVGAAAEDAIRLTA